MKWFPGDCREGDMIRIPVGSFFHYGIYVSDSEVIEFGPAPDGRPRDESSIRVGVTDIGTFSGGKIVEVGVCDRREARARRSPKETVDAARAGIGSGGYSLLHNNCEHFAYLCAFGVKKCTAEEEARKKWNLLGIRPGSGPGKK